VKCINTFTGADGFARPQLGFLIISLIELCGTYLGVLNSNNFHFQITFLGIFLISTSKLILDICQYAKNLIFII